MNTELIKKEAEEIQEVLESLLEIAKIFKWNGNDRTAIIYYTSFLEKSFEQRKLNYIVSQAIPFIRRKMFPKLYEKYGKSSLKQE